MWIPKLTSSVNRGQIIMTENAKEIPKCAQCPLREKSEKNPNSPNKKCEYFEEDLKLAALMNPSCYRKAAHSHCVLTDFQSQYLPTLSVLQGIPALLVLNDNRASLR
jgi:hypothetical protein